MSDEERTPSDAETAAAGVPVEQPNLDEHTTEPNAVPKSQQASTSAAGGWKMPEPKFQQTSGYLPQGYLKEIGLGAAQARVTPGSENTTQEQAPYIPKAPASDGDGAAGAKAAVAIEPQPDLTDQLIPEEPAPAAASVSPAKSGSRAPFIIAGIIGILVFAAAFLAAVYYFFLAKPPGGDNF